MLVSAIVLKVNIAWVAIGSMANLGGIYAPAVTSAYKELLPHIVLAILSMVTEQLGNANYLFVYLM